MSMASASNQVGSSCFPSSSSTPHWSHDVFLSFRGTDTRKNFTSHLYKALKDVGIETFIDDEELPTGKEIKPELRKAIQESKMSIIVFSKNYAASRWCLDELGEILECKRTMGQLVLPLFYDVEPSVVRHQTESYEEAFQKFVGEWDKPKVQNWRDALKEAADLSGHVLANEEDGNEAKFIAKIVMKVQREVNSRALNAPEHLIGVDSQVDCIDTLLSIGSNDVRTIGIYGMGGIGKTTVCKAVYNKHLNHFEVGAFVEDIKDVSKQPGGLLGLQEKLLNQLQKYNARLSNCDEGIRLIKQICSSKRVLILLDDLDDFDQIQKLVEHRRRFRAGSRVIIVTRDEEVLKNAQVDHTYQMKVLNANESLKLFRLNAFGEDNPFPSKEYKPLSIEATTYCGGLPLALEVIGRHMRGLTPLDWKNALNEFRKYPEKTILGRLKISYDALSEHGKKIFLDVACIFIGYNRDYLFKFWDGCGFSAGNSIRELLNKGLLKIDEKNRVRMHDHLRDMGREIVLNADSSLAKYSRVWTHKEVCDLLEHPKGAEAVEGISLDHSYLRSIALENKAFEAMHQLRFLLINFVEVTGSFKDLFGKLRWLSWRSCLLKCLPTDFNPTKLVVLDLKYSIMEKLWEGAKHLDNLKILDLSFNLCLVETPNFNGVQRLERLILMRCQRLSRIDPSICELRSLEELDLEGCSMLNRLPKELGNMKSLKRLILKDTLSTIGPSICEQVPEELGNTKSLKRSMLSHRESLSTIDPSICELRSLEELNLEDCRKLGQLPKELGNMKSLKRLILKSCIKLSTIHPSICELRSLEELDLEDCSMLNRLPKELGNMKSLKRLILKGCHTLSRIDPSICELRSLEELDLKGCSMLEQLPEELGNMKSLKRLMLRHCKRLSTIDPSICQLRSLEELDLNGCSKLERLPEELGNIKSLKTLELHSTLLEGLPDSIGQLSRLVHLCLESCQELKTLPTTICNLISLEELNMKSCSELKQLSKAMGNLKRLRTLSASGTKLEELPDSIGHLSSLVHLDLSGCSNLKTLPTTICNLISLEELNMKSCSELKQLPEAMGNLKRLRTLSASGTKLEELHDSIGHLSSLVLLDLSGCSNLKTLPTTICNLISLEELNMKSCSELKQLPEAMGNLKRLRTLSASGTKLEELPDSIGHLSSLVHLDLSGCSNLKTLPTTICNLISLEELNIKSCSELKQLPEAMGNLKRLRTLSASGSKLEELPDSIGHLSSLVHLDLSGCSNLKTLPDCICDLSSLEELNINRCRGLQQLPYRLGNMVSLRNLDAYEIMCQQLPDSIENLKKLERLNLRPLFRYPQSRFVLPFKIKSSLKTLKLVDCGLHDEDIPDDIGICLLSLQVLDLSRNDFYNLPSTLCQLSKLTELHLSYCKSLVSLPELPPNLRTLHASGCIAMEKIPNLSNLKHLRSLDLSDSNRLVEVKGLQNLKLWSLDVAGCSDLAMNTTFNESFFQRYFEVGSSILLPKWNFQNWIIYQSMKSTISFELPPSLPDNFQGIILWVVYARFSSNYYGADITNNTSGKEWRHFQIPLNGADIHRLEGQAWVSCIKSNFRGGDSIKISISENIYVEVEKCGVHWLIGSEGETIMGSMMRKLRGFMMTTETDFDLNTEPNKESSKRLRS